ncbi:hypothetical protein HKD37_13G035583 [Glycine soja]
MHSSLVLITFISISLSPSVSLSECRASPLPPTSTPPPTLFIRYNTVPFGAKAKRVKVVKGDFIPVANVGASQNKILADISNLPQQPKQHIFVDHHLGVYRLYLET